MNKEQKNVAKAILAARSRLQICHAQIREFADIESEQKLDDFHRDEILQDRTQMLAEATTNAFFSLRIAYEHLGLTNSLKAIEAEFDEAKDALGKVEYFDEFFGPHNALVDLLDARLGALSPFVDVASKIKTQRDILSLMLRQSGKYFEDLGLFPKKEKDVQDALYKVLRLAFPDVVREPAAPKQTKSYHPDFGIGSIETGIEVKFVADATKAATALGSLYEDMKGYEAGKYSFFFGLIFMTGNYLTQESVNAELATVGAPENWKVQVVIGPGKTPNVPTPT